MLRLALFDIDGTLISGRDALNAAAWGVGIADGLGLPGAGPEEVPHVGFTDRATAIAIALAYRLPSGEIAARVDRALALKDAYLVSLVGGEPARHPLSACPGAHDFIEALRIAGIKLGIVTGNTAAAASLMLLRAGFRPSDFAVASHGERITDRADLVGAAIAAARPFLPGLLAREVLVIGDTLADVASGRAWHTRTLAVASGRMRAAELAVGAPDLLVDSLCPTPNLWTALFGSAQRAPAA